MKRLLLCLAFTAAVTRPAHGAPIYSVTDLGTLGGDFSAAYSINDSGRVTGLSTLPDLSSNAFITGPNGIGMTSLGGFKGLAINASGQVIFGDNPGTLYITGPNGVGATPLGSTDPNSLGFKGSFTYGFGTVNASGDYVGTVDSLGNILADGPGIHGGVNVFPVGSQAFIAGPGIVGITKLGTLGGTNSFSRGINNAGEIVGGSNLAGTTWNNLDAPFAARRATLWDDGNIYDLNTLLDPNSPFLLSTSSFTLDVAMGINNEGQIAVDGFGYLLDGAFFNEAFLLTPVPEPSSLSVLGGMLICLYLLARRKLIALRVYADTGRWNE